jgi:hypothetical protein
MKLCFGAEYACRARRLGALALSSPPRRVQQECCRLRLPGCGTRRKFGEDATERDLVGSRETVLPGLRGGATAADSGYRNPCNSWSFVDRYYAIVARPVSIAT